MAFVILSRTAYRLGAMKFKGAPAVPTHERRTVDQLLAVLDLNDVDRLRNLHYALTYNRAYSRYVGWTKVQVAAVLRLIDEHLPPSKRIKHPDAPMWTSERAEISKKAVALKTIKNTKGRFIATAVQQQ